MPDWLKRLAGVPVAALIGTVLRWTGRRAGVALVYHAIDAREGDPDRELVPPRHRARFERDLNYLRRHCELVGAAQFAAAIASRRRGGRFPACITFDDDRPEHHEHALPLLRQHNAPATFFLCGASLQTPKCFWWERLQRTLDKGVDAREVAELLPARCSKGLRTTGLDIHSLAEVVKGLPPPERDSFAESLLRFAGPDPPNAGIRAKSIAALTQNGCTIGFHTVRHDELVGLDDQALERALRDGRSELEKAAGQPIETIAYPHGAADRRVSRAAKRAGFSWGFTVVPCPVAPASDPLLMGRLMPDGALSAGEFALAVMTTLVRPVCKQAAN